jgi:hypothetical protein
LKVSIATHVVGLPTIIFTVVAWILLWIPEECLLTELGPERCVVAAICTRLFHSLWDEGKIRAQLYQLEALGISAELKAKVC